MTTDNKTLADALTRFRCAGYDPTDGSGPIMVADPEGPWVLAADVIGTGSDCEATPAIPDAPESGGDWFGDVLGSIGTVIPLADVQPGGRVRLQQAIPPEGYAGAWIRSAYGQPSSFTYWNMEVAYAAGWQAALSAQPSPGGQEDAVHCGKCKGRGYVHVDVDVDDSGGSIGNIEACPHCAIAAPPSPGGQDARRQWLEVRGLAAGIVKNLQAFADSPHKGAWCGALDDALSFADQIEKDAAAAYESILAASQPVRHVRLPQSDLDLINDAAARQPVGEPVAWKYQDKAADGVWEDRIGDRLPCWEHRNAVPLYACSPAQAVALGQFRKAVEAWKRDAQNKHRAGEIFPEQKDAIWKEADRLLALIDSQAVGK